MSLLPPNRITVSPRLSVFIDADNIPILRSAAVLALARRHGLPDMIRAYGNACTRAAWGDVPGVRLIHSGNGKNAADMLICLDAMERALSGQCDTVLLVSSDQDFTHLATRLRERGLTVIGAGEAKTPARFRAACTRFEELPPPALPAASQRPDETDWRIQGIIRRDSRRGQGIPVFQLSNRMRAEHDLRISGHPDRKWRTYLAQRDNLYELHTVEGTQMVRFRPEAFLPEAAATSATTATADCRAG
jgi:uncharacterized LabA/DUF88 family protein